MRNPPDGWRPEGWTNVASPAARRSARDYTLGEALPTRQWWTQWLILFLNVSAGISLISQQAPLFQELGGVSAAVAAGMVGVVSIGNALGRVFWAWLSDLITRKATFAVMFLVQAVLFWILPDLRSSTAADSARCPRRWRTISVRRTSDRSTA
jgi:OFA family oxalate/formate antiporter-like MFS transporter